MKKITTVIKNYDCNNYEDFCFKDIGCSPLEINNIRVRDINYYCEKHKLDLSATKIIFLIDKFITFFYDTISDKLNNKSIGNIILIAKYLALTFNVELPYNILSSMETQKFMKEKLEEFIKNGDTSYINDMSNGFKSFFNNENHYQNYYIEIPYYPCFQPLEYDMLRIFVEELLSNVFTKCREEYDKDNI